MNLQKQNLETVHLLSYPQGSQIAGRIASLHQARPRGSGRREGTSPPAGRTAWTLPYVRGWTGSRLGPDCRERQ